MAQRSTHTYRPRALRQSGNLFRERDVAKRTFGYGKWFVAWSYVHVFYAIFMSSIYFAKFGLGWIATPVVIMSCFLQVALGNSLFKLPTKMPWTVFGLFLFFGYTIVSGVLANSDFGRNLTNAIGWQTVCLVFYGAISLSVMQATYINEKYREVVKWMIIVSLVLSGLVGVAQNFNIGGARTIFLGLEKQPPGIYRPTGLTDYPSQLGFQGMLGMVMLGAPLLYRNIKWWEWLGVAFFGLVILSAQYRSMYYAGIGMSVLAFGYMIWRRDRSQSVIFALVALSIIAAPLIAFPNRFIYGMRGTKDDPALMARQMAWHEAEPAMTLRPATGIGPDGSLLVATGMSTIPDRFSTTVLDNLYISVRTCYGWVGVILAAAFVVTTFGGLILRLLIGSVVAGSWAVASIMICISILLFSLTGNSIIYTTVGCMAAVIFSLSAPTWQEEFKGSLMTDEFVRIRTSFANALRKFGLNIG
jgi:hypothetical protein